MTSVAIVLAGGDPVRASIGASLPGDALVIAADSGVRLARPLGLRVDIVVGDLDSADPAEVARAVERGARVEQHRPDKDATDLELALVAACREGARRVIVVGGAGGRVDHFLANVALFTSARFAPVDIEAWLGDDRVNVVRGGQPALRFTAQPGAIVTLLAAGGDAVGITTKGLEYPLHVEDLPAGTSRGVSNVAGTDGEVSVALVAGVLLVIQPGGVV